MNSPKGPPFRNPTAPPGIARIPIDPSTHERNRTTALYLGLRRRVRLLADEFHRDGASANELHNLHLARRALNDAVLRLNDAESDALLDGES